MTRKGALWIAGLAACADAPAELGDTLLAESSVGSTSAGPPDETGTGTADAPSFDTSSSDDGTVEPAPDLPPVDPEPTARVLLAWGPTDDAELAKDLEVARTEDAALRRVVLRLGPDELPDIALGDRVIALAEAQVTTRCDVGQGAPGCDYDPKVGARIVLRGAADAGITLASQTQTCTKAEHHCMFVFRPTEATTSIDAALACVQAHDCAIELEMWAWDPDARAGGVDRVLVGENEGNYLDNGEVKGDKARLMAVRERDTVDADRIEAETTEPGQLGVPTDASSVLVYSHPLVDLRAGEQVVLDAKVVTAVASRARVSSKMYVTRDPADTQGAAMDGIAPRMIGEHNGTNCTAGASPCTTRKTAVFEVTEDLEGEAYVNIVIRSAVPGGGTTSVSVQRGDGWLRSTRYPAHVRG